MTGTPACGQPVRPTPGLDEFRSGEAAAREGRPLPADATGAFASGWTYGNVQRRIADGSVIGFGGAATRCSACSGVNYGHRMGCGCWPEGGWNEERNKAGGYAVDWGYFVQVLKDGQWVLDFITHADLLAQHAAGKPIVDSCTGEDIRVEGSPA